MFALTVVWPQSPFSSFSSSQSIQFVEQNVSRTKPGLFFLFIWVRKAQRLSSSWVVWVIRWISNLLLWGDCSVEGGKNNEEWGKTILGLP